jgi:hypothetical protein
VKQRKAKSPDSTDLHEKNKKNLVSILCQSCGLLFSGAVAQLGERLNRTQEVASSNLVCSTFTNRTGNK